MQTLSGVYLSSGLLVPSEAATLGNFGCTVPRQAIEDLRLIALFALGMAFGQLV